MNKRLIIGLAAVLMLLVSGVAVQSLEAAVGAGGTTQSTNGNGASDSLRGVQASLEGRAGNVLTGDDVNKASTFQSLVNVVDGSLDSVESTITELRRQATPPSAREINELENKLNLSEKAVDELAGQSKLAVDRLQESDLRDRLFNQKLSLEILRRRSGIGGRLKPFGAEFFQNTVGTDYAESSMVPANYVLRIKDKLMILAVSSLGAQTEYHQTIGGDGTVNIPGIGKIKAMGINIEQLNKLANTRIKEKFKQMSLDITLESVAPISVQVAGSVNNPGTYILSGLSTVMTALVKSGGPTPAGSMRSIYLTRLGDTKRKIDLYDFFLNGSKDQDLPLRDGDLIFVSPVGNTIAIDGQVIRPAIYEPTFPVNLAQAVELAAGARPGGYAQQISVERIVDGEYRVLINTSIAADSASTFELQPGDQITIFPVRPERTNVVSVIGPVMVPGTYEFSDGMRVSDLIKMAQGVNPEAFSGRADVLRINPLKGTELISFNLSKALEKDPNQDVELNVMDSVFLYFPDQVEFRNNRVRVSGAVSNPGVYDRKDGMRVSDAIAASGGILPEVFLQRADIIRYKEDGSQELLKVNLESALSKNVSDDLVISDRDELMVYTMDEVGWRDSRVRIEGSVQRPGTYKRVNNMRLSDLLFAAGGLLPESSLSVELGRVNETGKTKVITVNVAGLVADSEDDLLLQDRDIVTVASISSVLRAPEIVYLTGEVANPGPYVLSEDPEKLCDLIHRAGGLSKQADVNGLILMRKKDSFDNAQQRKDVQTVLKNIFTFANKEFVAQLSQMGIKLPDQFFEDIQSNAGDLAKSLGASDLKMQEDGIVKEGNGVDPATLATLKKTKGASPDAELDFGKSEEEGQIANLNISAASPASEVETALEAGRRLSDLTSGSPRALGNRISPIPRGEPTGLAAFAKIEDVLELARISVDFKRAIMQPSSSDNIMLRAGDRIHIPKQTDTVTVLGAVMHPHMFAAGANKPVSYYIERSGGYAHDAMKKATIVIHSNGEAVPANKVKTVVPGDMVVVPNTGIVDIAGRWEKMGSVTSVLSDILSTVYVLTKL